ncbi:peptidoglycan-associated lipoprotein [Fibrobacterales bacterium]|nr:peptidoglycan-associated lipoprotein [Fibrobacterales bacterium]
MKKVIVAIAAMSVTLVFFGCGKKKEPPAVEPPPPAVEEKEQVSAPTEPTAPKEDPLEAERRRLEELMNKIAGDDVYFEFDKFTLTSQAKDLLTEAGDILKKEPRFSVVVEGHTDARGTAEYNLGLGTRRADAVVQFLTNYGVERNRLAPETHGMENPKAAGSTEDDYAQNRRASFKVNIKRGNL